MIKGCVLIEWSHVRFNIRLKLYEPDIVPGVGSLHAVVEMVKTQTARQEEQQQGWEHQIYRGLSVSVSVSGWQGSTE